MRQTSNHHQAFRRTAAALLLAGAALAATAQSTGTQAKSTTTATTITQTTTEPADSIYDDLQMSVELGDLEVTAQRQLIKAEIDRVAYDVQADPESRTATALDMLRKVPLVTVDGQENIRVKGGSSFRIYKNGHPDPGISQNPKEVLKAIPASMIKRIEVITEPGAKYDAEGVTAILNIVIKDAAGMSGATGTLAAGIDAYGNPEANAYVTAQRGKWVGSVNYGYNHRNREGHRNRSDSYQAYQATGDTLRTTGEGDATVNVHYGTIEASFEPDTLNLLSASLGGFYYNYGGDGDATTTLTAIDGTPRYSFGTHSHHSGNHYYNANGRVDFQHRTSRPGETLTASYMLSSTLNKTGQLQTYDHLANAPMTYLTNGQKGNEHFWEHTWQLDWTRPLAQGHTLETGLKYIYRSNRSHTTITLDDTPDTESRFKHLTHVGAAYASYTLTRGAWTARAGLRYEWSRLRANYPDGSQEPFHRTLNDWVPSASVNYNFGMTRSLKWAFSTAIARPGISYLNPAVVTGPTSVHYGNAHLSSARNHSTSITYMQVGPKFTFNLSPSVGWSNSAITTVKWSEGGLDYDTYQNTLESRSVALSGFCQWQVAGGTSLMVNGEVSHNRYHSDALELTNSGRWGSFVYAQLTQQLPWQLQLIGHAGKWGGGTNDLYSHDGDGWFYGLTLMRSFLPEKRLSIRLSAQKPFSPRYGGYNSYTTQGDYTGRNHYEWTQRNVSLQVSYRFGSLNARVKKTDKTIENNDVVGASTGSSANSQSQPQ